MGVPMKKLSFYITIFISLFVLLSCTQKESLKGNVLLFRPIALETKVFYPSFLPSQETDVTKYEKIEPKEWGERVTGVRTQMKTEEKIIALTFDACGGPNGSGYDEELIQFLMDEKIPATLFINEQWILANKEQFLTLANHPLFQIENHGTNHKPLSVNGKEAWGIQGTNSPQEVYEEIMKNHQTVKKLTGREMTFFRSGTAYYDEVAIQIAQELGYEVVNFDILGDAGATFSSEQVKKALLGAENGSIVLLHMNQPSSGTAEGVKQAIPLLRDKGFTFVPLENQRLQ